MCTSTPKEKPMSLLETVIKASAQTGLPDENPSELPIILETRSIFSRLELEKKDSDDADPLKRVVGWEISELDSKIIDVGKSFVKNLKRKMKNPKMFKEELFVEMLNTFLGKILSETGVSISETIQNDIRSTSLLLEKVGMVIGRSVMSLVVANCLDFELWEFVGTVIRQGSVSSSTIPGLLARLVRSRRADLVVLCIQHFPDLRASDLLIICRYFLSCTHSDMSMLSVKKEWEANALCHIAEAKKKFLPGESRKHFPPASVPKNVAISLSIAHDGFLASEVCLHYLLASSHGGLVLSAAFSELEPIEILNLLKYLLKWLKKYARFPEALSCISSQWGLQACPWIPSLEVVVNILGMVLDEHFMELILHTAFHEELKSMQKMIQGLVDEANLACSISLVIESLRLDA